MSNPTPCKWTLQRVEELKEEITKAAEELRYLEAVLFLDNLAQTAETVYVDYLAEHYGTEKVKSFESDAFRNLYGGGAIRVVKSAISRYKSQADTTKNPEWGYKAKKEAKHLDEYNAKRRNY
jgi:hypothetical protein